MRNAYVVLGPIIAPAYTPFMPDSTPPNAGNPGETEGEPSEREQFGRFMKRLMDTPKTEIDAEREAEEPPSR